MAPPALRVSPPPKATIELMLMLLSAVNVRLFGLGEVVSELMLMSPAPAE